MTSEKVKTWFRKYWPWLAAGAGIILLYILYVNRQGGAATVPVSAGTQTGAPAGPTAAQISASTQLESTALTLQEKFAEAQLTAQTQQQRDILAAQTRAGEQATTQAGQQATLAAIQAGQSGQTTRSIISTVGSALPSILQAFRPPAGTVISSDTTFPSGSVAPGTPIGGGAVEGGVTGQISGIPLPPPLSVDETQASTIILPTPTFDSQGPPLESFAPFLGGVSASTDFSFV